MCNESEKNFLFLTWFLDRGFFIQFYLHVYVLYSIAFLKLLRYRAKRKKQGKRSLSLCKNMAHHRMTGGGEKAKVAAEIFWFVRIDTPD